LPLPNHIGHREGFVTGNIKERYVRYVDSVVGDTADEVAMGHAVGGAPEVVGILELALLRYAGLRESDYLIDIGCGSGRLTLPLSRTHKGRYLGTDLVPALLNYNKAKANRDDWRFEEVDGLTIPEATSQADMICFFSVFTHLLHEQTFLYLEEARRVLRPGGRVVFSFLEFDVHWDIFHDTVERERAGKAEEGVLNVFMERSDIRMWAYFLDFDLIEMPPGREQFIPLPHPVTAPDGRIMKKLGALGQSVCVLQKPLTDAAPRTRAAYATNARQPNADELLKTLTEMQLEKETTSSEMQRINAEFRRQREISNSELRREKDEVAQLKARLQQVYASRSWALTRPWRFAGGLLKPRSQS
jgi:SAM-dependent methyltransferase